MHELFFYNNLLCLNMFRALCAHYQEVNILLYNVWYHDTCKWHNMCTERLPTGVMIPDAV